jgi:hypothetical protein
MNAHQVAMKQRFVLQVTLKLLLAVLPGIALGASPPQGPTTAAIAAAPSSRWSAEQAWAWYDKQPWGVGFNYVPSTAGNTTEFWAAETFDAKTIDRELGWGAGLGFNSCRVFVQYLVWKHDPDGLKKRLDQFLTLADRHGLTTTLVLFDDCAFGEPPQTEPYLGKQRDPIPGMIAPSWTPSPGLKAVADKAAWPDLEKYVKDVVAMFGQDKRVLMWDLYNEPGNSGMGNKSLPLVEATSAWARAARPSQPLTIGPWGAPEEISRRQIELSDVITFHFYGNYDGLKNQIAAYKKHGRPVINTEWMARLQGSRWDTDLPLFKDERVGCYSWGLVNGRAQFQFAWFHKRGTPEPKVWFHDLFHADGRPYDAKEHEVIRKTTANKGFDGRLKFRGDGRFKIVQLTDIHWLQDQDDAQQTRQKRTLAEMAGILDAEHPDLVLLTGDIVTVKSGADPIPHWPEVLAPIVARGIPWAVVLGNHDDEWNRRVSRKDIVAALEKMPCSVTTCGPDGLGGNGNYVLRIEGSRSDKLAAVLYCLDSGAYSADQKLYGQYAWFTFEQIAWYREQSRKLTEVNNGVRLSALAFFHIPVPEFVEAGLARIGNFGEPVSCAKLNPGMFTAMMEKKDVMAIVVGHDHLSDYAGCIYGVCLAFGRKTGSAFAAYGKPPLPSGARVIELAEGKREFDTWIRTADGKVEFRIQYPDGFTRIRPAPKPTVNVTADPASVGR